MGQFSVTILTATGSGLGDIQQCRVKGERFVMFVYDSDGPDCDRIALALRTRHAVIPL